MKTKQFLILTAIICMASLFSVDLAYAYHPVSPYAFCNGNPIRYVDPDGRTIQVYDYVNEQRVVYEWRQNEGKWGFYDSHNAAYAGDNAFIGQLSGALNELMAGGNAGFELVSGLANHSNVVTMWQRDKSATIGNDIGWNPTGITSTGPEAVLTTAGIRSDPMITLGHELGHIEDAWSGTQHSTWFSVTTVDKSGNQTQKPISTSEIYTTHIENRLRSENGLPLRTHYSHDQYGVGMGPRIIVPSTGASRYYNAGGVTNYSPLRRGTAPYIY